MIIPSGEGSLRMSFLHQAGSGSTTLPAEHICMDNATGQKDAGSTHSAETTHGSERVDPHGWTTPGEAVV
jgi:hypothetical protein